MDDRMGAVLVQAGKISQKQLDAALAAQRESGGRLDSKLVGLGYLKDHELVDFLSKHFGVPAVDLGQIKIDAAVIKIIPAELARKYTVLPISKAAARLTVAMTDPTNVFALDDIKFMTGYTVEPVVAAEESLRTAIDRFYGSTRAVELKKVMDDLHEDDVGAGDLEVLADDQEIDLEELQEKSEEAPVVRLVNVILYDAIKRGASDIHIEPFEKEFRVRYRIDGVLYEVMNPPLKLKEAITSRLKIMARLDIAEKRLPQDGRIKMKTRIANRVKDLDFRVSVLPTLFGEKIVLRLLDKDNLMLDMTQARLRAGVAASLRAGDPEALRDGAPDRAHRLGQDQHALQRVVAHQHARGQHHHGRGPGRVQPARRQSGAGQGERSASTSRPRCARSCGRTPTSSWSARSETSRPPRWRSRPP